jgi:hypothetical protein
VPKRKVALPKIKVASPKKKKGNASPNLQSRGHSVNACASKNALWDNAFTDDPTVQELLYLDDVSEDDNDDSDDDDSVDDDSNNYDSDDDPLVVNLGKGTCVIGVSFQNHCYAMGLSSDFSKNRCRKTHDMALTSIGVYVAFPSSTVYGGYFSKNLDKIFVTAQLFCDFSSFADLGQVNQSVTDNHGEIEFHLTVWGQVMH